jgi:leader peptidase (prepilin peptidase) / N-methyltransferase
LILADLPGWLRVCGGGLFGLIIGSFIATLVIRWPQGRSVLRGRSACDQCGQSLTTRDLVPLFSWLLQRGACRHCKGRIAPLHSGVEAAAAAIGGLSLWASPDMAGVAGALFGWLLLALGSLDALHFWLPDRLTALLALTGVAGGVIGLDPPLVVRLWGGFAGFLGLSLIAIAYRLVRGREGLGGGDPKLFGAIGLWLGWTALPLVILPASGAGLGWVLAKWMGGTSPKANDQLPLGTLLSLAAWSVWLFTAATNA